VVRSCEEHKSDLMALLDGTLHGEDHDRLLKHLEHCETCRDEYHWLKTLVNDLERIGDAMVADTPEIDIVDAVMSALDQAEVERKVMPVAPRPRARLSWAWTWAGALAAAAVVLVLAWWLGGHWPLAGPPEPPRVREAHRPAQKDLLAPTTVSEPGSEVNRDRPDAAQLERAEKLLAKTKQGLPLETRPTDRLGMPELAALTVGDVLEARREVVEDDSALARLSQWAALSPERARQLALSPKASWQAIAGACQALPPEEAEPLLQGAVEQCPKDPQMRLALAKALSAQPEKRDAAASELARLSELDPDNALPDYMRARDLLAAGDLENALSALDEAAAKETASAYATMAAACREQALAESGMQFDTAHLLTAVTAGTEEYASFLGLGEELLKYGEQYEAAGNLKPAKQIYEGVYRMGGQVYDGAEFGAERLAGLDLQRAAVDFLEGVYIALDAGSDLQWLGAEVDQLTTPIEALIAFFDSLNNLFLDLVEGKYVDLIADIIHQFGDLSLFDHLQPSE